MRTAPRDRPILTTLALIAAGVAIEACGGEGPQSVAERFWEAARERDVATVEALSIPSAHTRFAFDDDETDIGSISFGDTEVDGGRAEVETRLEMQGEEMDLDVEFMTIVARHEGEWLVDLEETTGQIMGAVLGASMQELGEAIGEGMREAMEGMAEGLAEGMEDMAEAFENGESGSR